MIGSLSRASSCRHAIKRPPRTGVQSSNRSEAFKLKPSTYGAFLELAEKSNAGMDRIGVLSVSIYLKTEFSCNLENRKRGHRK
jgi:hypothetical protein